MLTETAAIRMTKAPGAKRRPSPSPNAMSAAPKKLTTIPTHPAIRSRSPKKAVARSAVKIGAVLTSRLAGPAATVISP